MSLFSLLKVGASIFSKGKSLVDKIRGKKNKIKGAFNSIPGAGAVGAAAAAGVGMIKRGLPAIRGQLPGIAGGVAAGALGGVLVDQFGNPIKKRRRINPANGKALTRALRRVESFQKIQKRIEKSMRRACPPARRRASPSRCN